MYVQSYQIRLKYQCNAGAVERQHSHSIVACDSKIIADHFKSQDSYKKRNIHAKGIRNY